MLHEVTVQNLPYKSLLGTVFSEVKVTLDEVDFKNFKKNKGSIEGLNYGISNDTILELEKIAGLQFFRENFKIILAGKTVLSGDEIRGIVEIFGVSRTDAAKLLGISKGQLTHLVNGERKASKIVSILLLERLGMELGRPGSAKALLGIGEVGKPVAEWAREVSNVKYASKKGRAA